ncbi:MAG: DinB family protein [Terriglobales bacterium]
MNTLERFADVIVVGTQRLHAISDADAGARPKPDAWSRKQELGHLVDSAINNYARVIRVQNEDSPSLLNYDADVWVERRGYQDEDWKQLIALWAAVNQHLLAAARGIPSSALARSCTIGGAPMTLGFMIEDYVDHLVHHLQHIGVELRQLRRAESAYA